MGFTNYKLNGRSPPSTSSSFAFLGHHTSLQGWHNRLGHPSEKVVRRLVSQFALPLSSNKFPVCDLCHMGKSHRLRLPNSHVRSSSPFELIYSDLWGPAPISSNNGNCYFVHFVDDHSKFIWIYFLSAKSQVFDTFKKFKAMVETQFNCQIKQLQTDWGGEYRNVSTLLDHLGIIHRESCPHTQEQNGAAERRHRDIVEKGLALLAHASLPLAFWEYAFNTAVYLINRLISPILDFQSPYHLLYHRDPDYSFLKTFGCLCYPFLRPYNKTKLDFRSQPCVFVGYSSKHKGYLCFHPNSNRVFIVRHVALDESVFPYPSMVKCPSHLSLTHQVPLTPLQVAASLASTDLHHHNPSSTSLSSPSSESLHSYF